MITDDELDRIAHGSRAARASGKTGTYVTVDKIDALVAEVRQRREDAEESDALRARMGRLLSDTAIALNGPEPELTSWSWHDLPEKAQAAMDAIEAVRALCAKREWYARDAFGGDHAAVLVEDVLDALGSPS